MCTGQLSNFVCYLHRNHPELHGPSAPGPSELDQPSGTLQNLTLGDLIRHLHRKVLLSAPEPSSISSAIYAGTLRNLARYLHRSPLEPFGTHQLISHLHRNCPEPHQLFARNRLHRNPSEPAICTRNLISHLHRNPPEPCLLSAPEPSGTSSASCPGTVRNLISHLHRNPPEPHQQSAPEGSGTLRNLLRNLVLQLHRIAPELFWAKDPIASFAVGEKTGQ